MSFLFPLPTVHEASWAMQCAQHGTDQRQGRSTHRDMIGLTTAKDNSAQPLEAKRQIAGRRLARDFGSLQDHDRCRTLAVAWVAICRRQTLSSDTKPWQLGRGHFASISLHYLGVQMSAPGGGSSDRSDAASPMSIASDISDEGVELEVGDSDNDSTLDDRMSSYTKSVTSSVVDYPTEHGRRYHAFRAGGPQ
ncbi:hypothetical protein BDP67DRAFT_8803 [Colletotrichum lupini]|nr:hypothetical protein BDP67DRAFT_8803 [Colletotrichum lupini]